MRRPQRTALRLLPLALAAAACDEQPPTSIDGGLFPVEPLTFEVRVPWESFASNLRVFGGFGEVEELGRGLVAEDFGGDLDARTLIRLSSFPTSVTVTDTVGVNRPDTLIRFVSGRLIAIMDTVASTNEGPVTLRAGRLPIRWDGASTTWELAIDTTGQRTPWPEPGAGPVVPLPATAWSPTTDSAVFVLDSAEVNSLRDSATVANGIRLAMETTGERAEVIGVLLRLKVRASIRPDTLVDATVGTSQTGFIYQPQAAPPASGLRVGGAPSWRSVLDATLPRTVTASPGICAQVGCPLTLTPERLGHAAIVLRSSPSEPAYRPGDTLFVDMREVLSPERLPKSPLGPSLVTLSSLTTGQPVLPPAFVAGGERKVEVSVTSWVREVLRQAAEEGKPTSRTLALLSSFEPMGFGFGSFAGPGEEGAPYLRLVVTVSDTVQVP